MGTRRLAAIFALTGTVPAFACAVLAPSPGPGAEGPPRAATPETAPIAARPAMPGPARARGDRAAEVNAGCERCHEAEAAEWRASLHRTADLEPTYRRAFAIEPLPFCRGCHAPEGDPEVPESEAVAALGVGCVTCHVTDGEILAAPWSGPGAPPAAPHPVAREERFATADACARCHEFAFPGTRGVETHDKMQWTVTEHARGPSSAVSCAGCHMPEDASGRRGHRFAASRDPAMLARAVRVTVTRSSASGVHIELAPAEAGHAFPTGDLFRRVEVLAEVEGPDHMSLGSDVRYLGRHFAPRAQGAGRRLLRDDRVHTEPVAIDLDVGPAGAGRAIVYRVAYQRVEHPNGVDEGDATVDSEVVLATGALPPPAGLAPSAELAPSP